jgi:argininosuccinate lyase
MPNKRNPDVIELMRAAAATVQGAMMELILTALPSGYHRDLQLSKGPAGAGRGGGHQSVAEAVANLGFDEARMRAA